jgi:hypothetical protein
MPWTSRRASEVRAQVIDAQFEIPCTVTAPVQDLLPRMMNPNPEERPTITELRARHWVGAQGRSQLELVVPVRKAANDSFVGVKGFLSLWAPGRGKLTLTGKSQVVVRPEATQGAAPVSMLNASNLLLRPWD